MPIGLLGRKVGMTQIFDEAGTAIQVTVIEAGPCNVLQVRSVEKDGYEAVQLGFADKPRRLASRSVRGHVAKLDSKRQKALATAGTAAVAKAGCEPKRFIREIRGPVGEMSVGQEVGVAVFDGIKSVDVIGFSKGRGTGGVMERHGFSGQRATHGVKKCHRHAGSTGNRTFPGRLFKGHRMAGRYGDERVTMRNLKVVRIDGEKNLLLVRGAVPGATGAFVIIRQSNKL